MTDLRTTEHARAESCKADHCHWHDVDEPAAGAHRVCFECGHAFITAEDLVAAHNAVLAEMAKADPGLEWTPETDADQVFSCPFCVHDW